MTTKTKEGRRLGSVSRLERDPVADVLELLSGHRFEQCEFRIELRELCRIYGCQVPKVSPIKLGILLKQSGFGARKTTVYEMPLAA